MRGIVLAGGTGSRLGVLTKVVNKHILPVGDRPMIEWPIKVLRDNYIDDITIVSSPRGIGQIAELLGGGYEYRVQDRPGGIVSALACAWRRQVSDGPVVVVLGDNVFTQSPVLYRSNVRQGTARCFLKILPDSKLRAFGVPRFNDAMGITEVVEKPEVPPSCYAVVGLYVFEAEVFNRLSAVKKSVRDEVEISDLLNVYAFANALEHTVVNGFWGDAGTVDGLAECTSTVLEWKNN